MSPEEILINALKTTNEPEIIVKLLKQLKNQIIGNKTRKQAFLKLKAISILSKILIDSNQDDVKIQSAIALTSFAFSGFEMTACIEPLFSCLSSGNSDLSDACARALKVLLQSNTASFIHDSLLCNIVNSNTKTSPDQT